MGKIQIQTILKKKHKLLDAYKANADSSRKRLCYCGEYDDIDEITWHWFELARSQNIPISGPMIQEQAREYAKELHNDDCNLAQTYHNLVLIFYLYEATNNCRL